MEKRGKKSNRMMEKSSDRNRVRVENEKKK